MKTTLLILFSFFSTSIQWLVDFEEAKSSAAERGKYILLNFSGSDWCGSCIKMKKEVFESDAFSAIAEEKLILLRADFPRSRKNQLSKEQIKHNELLAEKYNPKGKFPLTLLLDDKGEIIKEWDGYAFGTQEKFLSDLKKTLSLK
jgi:thioredoxin-related protein